MLDQVTIESQNGDLASFMETLPNMNAKDWRTANRDYKFRSLIADNCYSLIKESNHETTIQDTIHNYLGKIYDREFSQPELKDSNCETQPILRDIAAIFEEFMLDFEVAIAERAFKKENAFPHDGKAYIRWLKALISDHCASSHPFYHSYLADHGTLKDIKFLLAQETCLDPRFDDILALIQLGVKEDAKMEIAANYWDEMGNGKIADMHTVLFSRALDELEITEDYIHKNYLFEAKLCGNLSAALALSRRHYYKAVGYFGVTEYLAPRRFRSLITAWRRLGLSEDGAHYHDLHINVDAGHAAGWFRNVVKPAVDHNPQVGHEIALGALLRLNTSERYLDALLPHTNFNNQSPSQEAV